MLETTLKIFQVVFSLVLIGLVMMHSAKGDGIGAIGSSAKVFGSQKGVESGLNKLTTAVVAIWILIALVLAFLSYHH